MDFDSYIRRAALRNAWRPSGGQVLPRNSRRRAPIACLKGVSEADVARLTEGVRTKQAGLIVVRMGRTHGWDLGLPGREALPTLSR